MLAQSTQPPAINESSFAALFEESLTRQEMRAGEVITAEVISVDQNVVIVNAGLKSESAISTEEFKNDRGELEVKIGDFVSVAIEALEDGFGATKLSRENGSSDFIAVNETHVTEMIGVVTPEDERFFKKAHQLLKPGGYLVWGNAIPDPTWSECFKFLEKNGFTIREECDVTKEAVKARDEDKKRIDVYVDQCIAAFHGFRIPFLGARRREQADIALKNFARNPGTRLYQNMVERKDTYRVMLLQKTS